MPYGREHDDKSLCPSCNRYSLDGPHQEACPFFRPSMTVDALRAEVARLEERVRGEIAERQGKVSQLMTDVQHEWDRAELFARQAGAARWRAEAAESQLSELREALGNFCRQVDEFVSGHWDDKDWQVAIKALSDLAIAGRVALGTRYGFVGADAARAVLSKT